MADDQWWLRGVDEATKRKIKAYAAQNGVTIAEALKRLVEKALEGK